MPKLVGTVLIMLFLKRALFSKRAVDRGRFFEEGSLLRALFRRGWSTEDAFSGYEPCNSHEIAN